MPLRRSTRERRNAISDDYIVYLQEREVESGMMEDDPINFQQAMKSSNSQKWIEAMNEEYKSMQDNKVWELVPLPVGTKPIGCKWIFKTKRDSNGNVERYKARLVAKGFTQKEGIDFKETFSPVSTKDSFRIIMALVAHYDLELHQMDVKTCFSMQASRQWYFKFHQIIVSYGFEANLMDECVYHKFSGRLSQRTYIDKVLQRYVMQNSKPGDTPVAKGDKFSLNQCPKNSLESQEMQKIPYASAVGSLMYAQVCTRPDIAYIVGMLGRYLSNPGMDHWRAAKRVMRYLQRTKEYMLTYRRLDQLELIGYSDSDFAGCQDSRRSTSGYIYLLAGGAISWKSAKQTLVTSSTMEAEFVACYEASNQGIWLRILSLGYVFWMKSTEWTDIHRAYWNKLHDSGSAYKGITTQGFSFNGFRSALKTWAFGVSFQSMQVLANDAVSPGTDRAPPVNGKSWNGSHRSNVLFRRPPKKLGIRDIF
ncbi:Copia protein [Vitis vinifera]|uniref:Copia protein n=1 Tax=Vitis vinifera TaxID=29760 RepID=A0A438JXU5_VITVI|nr:Copia protein [Vitis vinifera]